MKKIFFIIIITVTVTVINCFGQKNKDSRHKQELEIKADSLEYELLVFDTGFDSWLATQKPMNFYSKGYYETKNRLDVIVWNQRFMSSMDNELYDNYIDYKPGIDYGLDLNYRLFYYFRYFEEQNRVILYPKAVDWVNVFIFSR